MKKLLISMACCLTQFAVYAQLKNEVTFTVAQNWTALLKQAKLENKIIFVDAYATWCGPCKKMDSDVYTDSLVADYSNKNYISVKVQIDQTKDDSQAIKDSYGLSGTLQKKYNIIALPTFLFINENDELVYRGEGYQNPEQFLSILKNAGNPQVNFADIVKEYSQGKIVDKELLKLSLRAKHYHQDSLAIEIAKQYKTKYINKNAPTSILTEDFREYLMVFTNLFSLNDPIIKYITEHSIYADSLLKQKGFSSRTKEYYVVKEIVNPIIKSDGKYSLKCPNWIALEKKIRKQCDVHTTKKLIINAKLNWFSNKKDWSNIVKYNIEKVELLGIDTAGLGGSMLNNMIFEVIFTHSSDPYALNKGIGFMETILKTNPKMDSWIDTYANLLYKIGRKNESLKHEEIALTIAAQRKDSERMLTYKETLEKMRNNLPTW